MSREEKDKKNKQAGIFISVGTHIAVTLLFIFLVAWRAPNPPLPEFGIELNFGTSDQGTGDIQPETTPAEAEQDEDALPDTPEEVAEETIETPETVKETTEVTDAVEEEIVPVTEQETEVPVKEPEKTPEEVKVVEVEKEKPIIKAQYPDKQDGADGKTNESKDAARANEGDDTDALGDQGDKDGDVDARAIMGKQGGGGDSELDMPGWVKDFEPRPNDNTQEFGRIIFKIIIDDRGEIVSVSALKYTVSASLVKIYQTEVEKLTFTKTSKGQAALRTEGTITFIIKAK